MEPNSGLSSSSSCLHLRITMSPTQQYSLSHLSSILFHLILVLVLLLPSSPLSQSVKTLPGFSGGLPFKLETGYIGVGESDEVQLFYYFVESERNPEADPLVLWLTGGPGCSALSGLMYEIGPFTFNYANSSSSKPTLELNQHSWTKVANIIFLDSPIGTGFSYAKTSEGYTSNDTLSASQTYNFLRKWLLDHPKFLRNQLYIAGDSYSGIVVPIIVQEIYEGNDAGNVPRMNIEGYMLGNPLTDEINDLNSRLLFAHRLTYLSDDLYASTKSSCHGNYMEVDTNNTLCVDDLQLVQECIEKINIAQTLEPLCDQLSPKPNLLKWDPHAAAEDNIDLLSLPSIPGQWCRQYNYLYSYIWANDPTVQEALHVREGTKKEWLRCNRTLSGYTSNINKSLNYHKNLTKRRCRALIYSGDHDMMIPYVGTQAWINLLNLPDIYDWKPWFVDGEVGGFTEQHTNKLYWLTFATVKGGGHTAPEYKPKECLAMVSRWLAHFPL